MSEQNKPQGESKPQKPAEQKPTPSQGSADFATQRVWIGDSADPIIKHKK